MHTQEATIDGENNEMKADEVLQSESQSNEIKCGQNNGKENSVEQHKLSLMKLIVVRGDPSAKVSPYPEI